MGHLYEPSVDTWRSDLGTCCRLHARCYKISFAGSASITALIWAIHLLSAPREVSRALSRTHWTPFPNE